MDMHSDRGLLDMQSRVLAGLLSKTSFKDSLQALLRNIDPENSPKIIRTLMETDPEVLLSVMSALPAVADCVIRAADELLRRIRAQYPPELLQGFARSLLEEIDRESLARVISQARQLSKELSPVVREALDMPGLKDRSGNQEVTP